MLITHGGEIVSEEVSLVDVEDAAILQTSLLRAFLVPVPTALGPDGIQDQDFAPASSLCEDSA